jgi:hypothetical protein
MSSVPFSSISAAASPPSLVVNQWSTMTTYGAPFSCLLSWRGMARSSLGRCYGFVRYAANVFCEAPLGGGVTLSEFIKVIHECKD